MMMFSLPDFRLSTMRSVLALGDVAAEGGGPMSLAGEVLGQRLGRALGIDEDQDAVDRFGTRTAGYVKLLMPPDKAGGISHDIS